MTPGELHLGQLTTEGIMFLDGTTMSMRDIIAAGTAQSASYREDSCERLMGAVFGEVVSVRYPTLPRFAEFALCRACTNKERGVLELRFGLVDGGRKTLREVGVSIGVGPERVRQIQAKALRKLRHPQYSRALLGLVSFRSDSSEKLVR